MMRLKLYLLLGALFLVLGCSAKYGSANYAPQAASMAGRVYYEEDRAEADYQYQRTAENSAAEQGISENDLERKIVMTAHVRVRVENLNEADTFIKDLMKRYNAYASSTDIDDNIRRYSIRVPSSAYKAAIDEINGIGRLLGRSESAEDVTLRYYDLEGRLATKKELLKTFQSYLGKAKTIEEILSVEKNIAELQYEIEGTGKELRNLATGWITPQSNFPFLGQ